MSDNDKEDLLEIDMPLNYVRGFADAVDLLMDKLLDDKLGPTLTKEQVDEQLQSLAASAQEKKNKLGGVLMFID